VTVAEAAAPAEQPAGSSRTLLLVILGALALAGLTGSMIYRIGRARDVMRATARRRDIRPSADPARRSPWADIPPEDLADVAHHSDYAPPQSRSYAEDWVAPSLGSSR
jgi:hypothetical protein